MRTSGEPQSNPSAERRGRFFADHGWAVLLLLGLVIAFFWPVLLGGQVLLPLDSLFLFPPFNLYAGQYGIITPHNELISDTLLQNLGWRAFARDTLAQGQLPLWNPYLLAGTPFFAAGQQAVLYPPALLFYLLPLPYAYGYFDALHLFLGGLFMYCYLRTLGAGRLGAVVGGIVFAFSGVVVVSLVWPMVVSTWIWLPLLLLAIEKAVRPFETRRPGQAMPWVLLGAAALGLQFLAGHMEIAFYSLFTMAFYAAARLLVFLWQQRSASGGGATVTAGFLLLGMVGLGAGLAGVQLLPFAEVGRENYRAGMVSYDEVIGWAYPKQQLAAFLMPDFFGNPTHQNYYDVVEGQLLPVAGAQDAAGRSRDYPFWGIKNYVEGTAYLGILPLLLAGLAFLLRRDRYTAIFGVYALFSLSLAFGSPLYRLFFYGVPGFDQLHTPFRWVFPYTVSIAVLAGLGVGALRPAQGSALAQGRSHPWGRPWGGVASLLGVGLIFLLLASRWLFLGASLDWVEGWRQGSTALAAALPSAQALYSYEFRNLLTLGMLLAASGLVVYYGMERDPQRRRLFPLIAVLLVVFDLFAFGYDFNPRNEADILELRPVSLRLLRREMDEGEPFRIATFGWEDTLKPNLPMFYGLQDIRGYDTIILKSYAQFWSLMEEPQGLLYSQINKLVNPSSLTSPFLDLLNVRYVFTTGQINLPGWDRVYGREINVYENEDVLPRAFALFNERRASGEAALAALAEPDFDPRRTVVVDGAEALPPLPPAERSLVAGRITRYTPNRVEVAVDMPQEGYLVLADSYFPGWQARLSNGQSLPLLRADHIFRAVRLGPGQHTVVFDYSPFSFKLGLYISLISLGIWLLALGYGVLRRLYGGGELSGVARLAKNSLTPMAAQFLNRAIDFGFAIFMLRMLGPELVGRYAFAVVLITYFTILTDFGLGTLVTREVARSREEASRYLASSIWLRLGLVGAAIPLLGVVMALYALTAGLAPDTALTVALLGLSLVPSNLAQALSSVFNGYELMEYPAGVTVVTTLLKIAFGVAALLLGWGIVGLAGVSIVVNLATAAILYLLLRQVVMRPQRLATPVARPADGVLRQAKDGPQARQMLNPAFPLMLNTFLATVFFRFDVLLLSPLQGDTATGYYSTAYRFIDGLNIIPAYFTLALFPLLARYAESDRESLRRAFSLALKVLLILAWPIAVGTTLIADQLIVFFFGLEYAPAILALQVLIWFLPFSFINSVTQYALIAVNRQRFLTLAFILGAAFNIGANLVVIPWFSFVGAAVVTILSELVLLAPFWWGVRQHLGAVPLVEPNLRPLAASLIMGLGLYLLRGANFGLLIGLGALIYGVALVALGTFGTEERTLLRQLRPGWLGRAAE